MTLRRDSLSAEHELRLLLHLGRDAVLGRHEQPPGVPNLARLARRVFDDRAGLGISVASFLPRDHAAGCVRREIGVLISPALRLIPTRGPNIIPAAAAGDCDASAPGDSESSDNSKLMWQRLLQTISEGRRSGFMATFG